jgi:hypothetical protein
MRFSHISLIAVMLVVIAVAVAGCSGTTQTTPSGGGTQATGSPSSGSSSSGSSGSQAAAVSGTDMFGGLNYNWVEYKTSTGSGENAMTVYMKWNRQTGKCSMRFEGAAAANLPANMQEMDCSPKTGQTTQGDPNTVSSDAKVDCALLEESVTVPAGTFSATKCTVTSKDGMVGTTWIAKGKFMVKMEASSGQGSTSMVLNAFG